MLFLDGGGGCFSPDTCLDTPFSPASIAAASHDPGNAGIFDRQNSENAVRDWSFVYVPYCTGDVFLGHNYRTRVKRYPTFSTFYVKNSSQHMWTLDDSFYGVSATAGGVRLVDWFKDVIDGQPGTHLGL